MPAKAGIPFGREQAHNKWGPSLRWGDGKRLLLFYLNGKSSLDALQENNKKGALWGAPLGKTTKS